MANGTTSQPAIAPPPAPARPTVFSASGADTLLPDAERDGGRTDARDEADFVRMRPREEHNRYNLDKAMRAKGMDYFWGAVKIRGQANPRLGEYFRAGWQPVRAKDYADISGLNNQVNPRLIELGFMPEVKPDDPIVDRDLMLLARPSSMSIESRAEDVKAANRQVDDQLNRLKAVSRHAIGDKTQISRRVERGANLVPDDDGSQEE